MFGRRRTVTPRANVGLPTVSVIIPCYNYGRYLPVALGSVLDQPGVDVQVMIIDDCSTDDSPDVARRLAATDHRVTVILHEHNMSHIATYNEGLAAADGDYVVLLSADDLLAPGSLQRATELMEANPGVGLVYGHPQDFVDSPPTFVPRGISWTVWSGADWIRRICRRGGNVILSPEAVVRGDVMRRLVGYRADMPHEADMELWLRVAAISDVGRVNGPDQAYYRNHGANMHFQREGGLWLHDLRARAGVFRTFFAEHPQLIEPGNDLLKIAYRALAMEAVRRARVMPQQPASGFVASDDFARLAHELEPRIAMFAAARSRPSTGLGAIVDRSVNRVVESYRWRRWRVTGT